MTKTLIGLFNDRHHVDMVLDQLKDKGMDAKDISIVMKDREEAADIHDDTGASVAEGAVSGATTGAVIGGLAGLLIGIGAIAIPGIGALLIGGPIAAALGLSGAAATTLSGAATGALAGGLIGALMGLGLSREEAEVYESHVKEGAILIAVPVTNSTEDFVRDVFEDHEAYEVKVVKAGARHDMDFDEMDEPVRTGRSHHDAAAMYAGAKGGKQRTVKARPGETVQIEVDED